MKWGLLRAGPSQLSGRMFVAPGFGAFQARLAQVLQRSVDSPGQLCELPVPGCWQFQVPSVKPVNRWADARGLMGQNSVKL